MSPRKRLFKLGLIFFQMFFDFKKEYSLIKKRGYKYAQKKMQLIHKKRALKLYNLAISMQGVLIKLCQFFSSRQDIFPKPYIDILSNLQDKVPPISFEVVEDVLSKEYKGENYFQSVDSIPLASASLGQVHKATLMSGEAVVLKVLKPQIEERIDTDFAILKLVFNLLSNFSFFRQRSDFVEVIDEFIRVVGDELNFRREVVQAKRFAKDLEPFPYIKVPKVYDEFCTDRIIVMEYIEGDKINAVDKWISRNNDPVLISNRIIEIYLEQFLVTGLVHFDPHPGNILITENSTIALIDFGMSGDVSDEMRSDMLNGLRAIVEKDGKAFIDVLHRQGFIRKSVNRLTLLPVVQFFIEDVFESVKFDRESIQTIDFNPILKQLVEIIYSHPFLVPIHWAFIIKTIGGIAGLTATLSPDYNPYDILKPYADKYIKQKFRETLKEDLRVAKVNMGYMLTLPKKMDEFVTNMETGKFVFHWDNSEVIDAVEGFKVFLIKFTSFFLMILSVFGTYVCIRYNYQDLFYILLSGSIFFLLNGLFYKKRTMKTWLEKLLH